MNGHTNPYHGRGINVAERCRITRVLFAASLLLVAGAGGCGKGPSLDATPPSSIGPLQQATILRADEAAGAIEEAFMIQVRSSNAWVSTYGEADRIEIFALALGDEVQTESVITALRAMAGREGSPYRSSTSLMVAQQQGFRADGEGKGVFFYARGKWVVLIRAMAADFDPAVASINWVRSAG